MFTELSAASYNYSPIFYNREFEDVVSKIIICYRMMISSDIAVEDDENKIRDVILKNYLRNNVIRNQLKLTKYLFDREVPEDNDLGRTDIKIQTRNTFQDTKAYYIIECKRLDAQNQNGTTGLNAKYISNGICRFVSEKYSNYKKTCGMILGLGRINGFITGLILMNTMEKKGRIISIYTHMIGRKTRDLMR